MANQNAKRREAVAKATKAAEEAKATEQENVNEAKDDSEVETLESTEQTPQEESTEVETDTLVDPVPSEEPPVEETQPTPEPILKEAKETSEVTVIDLPVAKPFASKKTNIVAKTELPTPAVSLATITIEQLVKRKHDFVLQNAEGDLLDILQFLDRYEEQMKGGLEIATNQGESLQKQMYKTYLRILLLSSTKERNVAMEVLLWKFYKNEKGAFMVTQLSRFTRNGRWIIQELNMFLQMNHIFNAIKNPQDRIVNLKHFKLSAIISGFPGDKIRYTESFLDWASSLQ